MVATAEKRQPYKLIPTYGYPESLEEFEFEELESAYTFPLSHVSGRAEDEEPMPDHKARAEAELFYRVAKRDAPQRLTYGVVSEPETEDLQGDIMSSEDIEKAAHQWMEKSRKLHVMHGDRDAASVVESYIAPTDMMLTGEDGMTHMIRKGSWVMTVRWSPNVWKRIEAGELTGYSIGGTGVRIAL